MSRRWLLLLLLALTGSARSGDLVLVVNPASGVDRLSRAEVTTLYMGRTRRLPSGIAALPIDQPGDAPDKVQFYRSLVGWELPEVQAFWGRLLFSGQASPPPKAQSAEELLKFIRNNKGAIGYVDRSKIDRHVKVVFEVGQ